MKINASRYSPYIVVLGAVAPLLLACGEASESGKGAESAADTAGLVGNPAPDFHVSAVAGSKGAVSLKGLRGKVVLVDFWGTFCEPCKKSFPKLQDLQAKYADSGLQIVGISEDEVDDKDKIPSFADTYGAKFAIGWDEDKAIARRYKPETMPSSFLIDKRGIVRYAHVGYHDGEEVEIEKEIKELLGR
jgi:peroxiredoxin